MKKMNYKQKKEIITKLKPFWEKYRKVHSEFHKKMIKIEKEMNKKAKPKFKLEFFYCDGEYVGIGASDYARRKNFPLIHDTELEEK